MSTKEDKSHEILQNESPSRITFLLENDEGVLAEFPLKGGTPNILEKLQGFAHAISVGTLHYDLHTWLHHADASKYMEPLCSHYGLPKSETDIIIAAAEVHDIGKLAVLDILLRCREIELKIESPEMYAIRRHVQFGHLMLSTFFSKIQVRSRAIATILNMVMYHHERWDGTGYPTGLARYAIPTTARLMAVVDATSAMSMPERSWRSPLSVDQVVSELRIKAGTQFDPEIANLMANILESGRINHTDSGITFD